MAIEKKDFAGFESLEEFKEAIDMRLDIEFLLYGERYNISTDGTPFIALCPDGEGDYYEDADHMLENHKIHGRRLKEIWKDIQILFM